MGMKQRKKCFWKQISWKLPGKAVQRSAGDYSSASNGFKEISLPGALSHYNPAFKLWPDASPRLCKWRYPSVSLPMKIFACSNNFCSFWQLDLENGQEKM
jgi:hypothetical protein